MFCARCGQPVLEGPVFCLACGWPTDDARGDRSGAAGGPAAPLPPAGFWLRLLAQSLDAWALLLALAPVAGGAALAASRLGEGGRLAVAAGLLATLATGPWLYYALLECGPDRATPGKRALGLVVTDAAGGRLGFGRATARWFARALSTLPLSLGYALAAVPPRKRALHDLVTGTQVVRRRPAGAGAMVLGAVATAGLLAAGVGIQLWLHAYRGRG